MEREAILEQFDAWPRAEQRDFVGKLIARLYGSEDDSEIDDESELHGESEIDEDVKAMLLERIAEADAHPENFYTSEEVEAYLRRQR